MGLLSHLENGLRRGLYYKWGQAQLLPIIRPDLPRQLIESRDGHEDVHRQKVVIHLKRHICPSVNAHGLLP